MALDRSVLLEMPVPLIDIIDKRIGPQSCLMTDGDRPLSIHPALPAVSPP